MSFLQAFLRPPSDDSHRSANVSELRAAEKAALKAAMRLEVTTKCSFADAIAAVVKDGAYRSLLAEKPKEKQEWLACCID